MATYAGNTSLSTAVKDRVISTFQQTLALYKQGRMDEVIAGCGLILRMDPMFDPAKKLVDKTRNPNLPIDVDTLLPADANDAMAHARAAMTARDYQTVVNITTEVLTNDLMNDEARILGDQARERLEAAPFVDQFLRKCEQNINNGNVPAARTDLEKARSLDPDHPAIARMEQLVARGTSGVQPVAAPSPGGFSFDPQNTSFVVDKPAAAAPPPTATPGRGPAPAADFGFTFEEEKPAAPAPASFSFDSFTPPAPPPAAPAAPSPSSFSFDSPAPTPPPAAPAAPAGFSFDAPSPAPSATMDALGSFSFGGPAPSTDAPFAGGFSFDSPAPAAPPPPEPGFNFGGAPAGPKAPATGEFDFATASIETSPDDQKKIQQYLADGDRAFDAGEFQQAIDLWSRIFLIDVTNEQASERIERAKVKRRDIEQKVEGALAAAVAAYDRGDKTGARAKFNDVLRSDPTNETALEYLERLSDTVTEGGAGAYEAPYTPPAAGRNDDDLFGDDAVSGSYEDSVLLPPDPMAAPPAAAASGKKAAVKSAPAAAKKPLPLGLIGAVVGLVVLLGGGWFVWSKYMAKPAVDPAATGLILKEAQTLAQQGKYDQAMSMLQDIKPDDPLHDKALVMMADLQHKKSQAAEMVDGRPAAVVYQENLSNGKVAFEAHDYVAAAKAFEAAQRIKALPADMKQLYDTASQQVAKLQSAQALFKERKFQDALASLQPLADADPQNKSIQRMLTDVHFNLGATALQEERLPDAIQQFDEVLKLDPNDELAKLAVRYNAPRQQRDLLYRIYVKYLPLRQTS
jgi:tetratricopeptide (TPR) repeat protein